MSAELSNLQQQRRTAKKSGLKPFTPTEKRIAPYVALGMTSKMIAREIGDSMAESTVQKHRANMVKKMGVSGSGALTQKLIKMGFADALTQSADGIALDGYWVSRFGFQRLDRRSRPESPRYVDSAQINLERLDPASGTFAYEGGNECGASKGDVAVYMHSLKFLVKHRMAVGIWDNGKNSANIGCFQLLINDDGLMMAGQHLGNTRNGAVRGGDWVWVKVAAAPGFVVDPKRFRSFAELNALIEAFLSGGPAPTAADLFT